jgi:hypothetical protein
MPQLERYKFIALRFLRQSDYEAASPLSTSPSPDITIRMFMLFRGLTTRAAVQWDIIKPSFNQGSGIWVNIVCPGTSLTNKSLPLSVVELGGMEVP